MAEHEEIIQPTHAKITIGVLLFAAVSFALEAVPVAVTAMFLPVFFGIMGILSFKEAFAGFAASAAYLTPVSTPPNTLVYGPGNLKFTDYVKSGLPLFFLAYIVAVLIVPMIWPFK